MGYQSITQEEFDSIKGMTWAVVLVEDTPYVGVLTPPLTPREIDQRKMKVTLPAGLVVYTDRASILRVLKKVKVPEMPDDIVSPQIMLARVEKDILDLHVIIGDTIRDISKQAESNKIEDAIPELLGVLVEGFKTYEERVRTLYDLALSATDGGDAVRWPRETTIWSESGADL